MIIKSDLRGKVILITGGTTGLGFELMRQLLDQGSSVAICARSSEDLEKVKIHFPEIFTFKCDVSIKEEVHEYVIQTIQYFGKIDVVINNAGIIMVAPMEAFPLEDYQKAMDVMFWGIFHTTFAVLPYMKKQGSGQIINITSIGGKVSVPHLLPYSAAKFAAVGFSEGIAIELRKHNIYVTTVIPGLMRTGSYVNALFQKNDRLMFKIFSALSSTPVLTMTAKKAARLTIRAIKGKKLIKVLGFPAKLLIQIHHFFPRTLIRIMTFTTKFFPGEKPTKGLEKGKSINLRFNDSEVTGIAKFGHEAQERYQRQLR